MGKIKHICIITYGYPTKERPFSYTFVDKLVSSFRDQNVQCTVIYPIPSFPGHAKNAPPEYWTKKTPSGNQIDIYSPRYPYFYTKGLGKFNTGIITANFFEKAVEKVIKENKLTPDCLYGHFIFPSGITVARIGRKLKVPAYFAYGESSPWSIDILGQERLKRQLKNINGVVAVSTAKKDELSTFKFFEDDLIKVFPNSVDHNTFYPRPKEEMRERFGFPKDTFIIGYTGTFNESKGVMRLIDAVNKLKNNSMKLVLIGGGKLNPQSDNIIFKGRLPHDEVPLMLSACDIFVLPTKNEGLSNAIVEAMSCGLPIISSDRSFNYDILSDDNSLLVDPDKVDEISNSILRLKESIELREKLAAGSLEIAKKLSIEQRAQNILEWMEYTINTNVAFK